MLTSKAVIQKIDHRSDQVHLYMNYNVSSPWSFETHQTQLAGGGNSAIFPFVFHGMEAFREGLAGRETKVHHSNDDRLLFADDYGVPGGFMIGVLFPEGYVPEVFKFKNKPFIPTGMGDRGASMSPPGSFDVYYNRPSKRSAVVFLTYQPTYFGFKCIARKRLDDFPDGGTRPFLSDLFATYGFPETHPIQATSEDLTKLKGVFSPSADLAELAAAINRLADLAKEGNYSCARDAQQLSKRIQDALSNTASAVQLADSYLSGGTVAAVVSRLVAYLRL